VSNPGPAGGIDQFRWVEADKSMFKHVYSMFIRTTRTRACLYDSVNLYTPHAKPNFHLISG
jgi:hypothetical protein